MVPPNKDGTAHAPSVSASRRNSQHTVRRRSLVPKAHEWWECIPDDPVRRNPFKKTAAFEFQVPEHLPSSPMCPANPKHVSGGMGLCVYHGRQKDPLGFKDAIMAGHNPRLNHVRRSLE